MTRAERTALRGLWLGMAIVILFGIVVLTAATDRCEQSTTSDQFLACREQGPRP